MRNSSSSSRVSSRSPTPSPSKCRSSTKKSPNISNSQSFDEDKVSADAFYAFIRYLGKHVFIVVISIIFGIFAGLSSSSLLPFLARILLIGFTFYLINLIFYKKGAKMSTQTFLTAFIVIAGTYFIVSCPLSYYIPSLILMAFCSYLYYRL